MAQTQIQEQRQEQRLQQAVTIQQLLHAQLVEMPVQQLIERIDTEAHDNPALEKTAEPDVTQSLDDEGWDDSGNADDEDYEAQREREERQDALDAALENFGRDDEELPVYQGGRTADEEREEMVYGASQSFYDQLLEQVGEIEQSPQDRYVMEYLIRSLDDDGLLRTPLENISDELAIYHSIDLTTTQIEHILKRLQQLDPPGIAARSLQECLLLQIGRRKDSVMKYLMQRVVEEFFDEFTKKHWSRIGQELELSEEQTDALMSELRRLNPKPGAAMGETMGRPMQQIIPDFIVDTQDDGSVTFTLNNGDVPQLEVSQDFADLIKTYQNNKDGMTRQEKEALLYMRQKVDAARVFIEAVKSRRRTLTVTMRAIITLQHRFFEEGDEALLRPMGLKDVAQRTGLDVSTISRVCNSKYAQTRWGIFPLKFFFSDGITTDGGEELSTREIKAVLRDLIDGEDKKKPLSDDALRDMLEAKGYPVARRTVAKYRQQLGYPVARLRK